MASSLPLIPQFFERFILKWAEKRQTLTYSQITINHRQLYILPTRHGIAYFLILLLILFGSINYENSLGYMLTFLLVALGFLAMIYTHFNINQLVIKLGRAEPVFAGQEISFPVYISQLSNTTRPNLKLLSETAQTSTAHLIDETQTECKLLLTTKHRGYISAGRIKLSSEYPLGLFHAWSWLKLQSKCLVYPSPDSQHHPLSFLDDDSPGLTISDKQGVDDFAGIRQYHPGDLPNHMAWKAIAKTGELQTKLFNHESSRKSWISWNNTSEILDTEQRLSILCRMIIDACENNTVYGLDIPGTRITPASGLQHKHQCLKSLALFGHHD